MQVNSILKRAEAGMKESNKILIQELIHDLEEKGINPVIAVEGKVTYQKLKILGTDEIKDYEFLLKRFGFEKSDFCLLEEDTTKRANDSFYQVTGNLIIVHKKTAKLKTYHIGHLSSWIADFRHDLENKFFTN